MQWWFCASTNISKACCFGCFYMHLLEHTWYAPVVFLEICPYFFMVVCSWVSHEFAVSFSHACNQFWVFILTTANLTGWLASESLLPQISGFYEFVLTQPQIPSEWEIKSNSNLHVALVAFEKMLWKVTVLALLQGMWTELS